MQKMYTGKEAAPLPGISITTLDQAKVIKKNVFKEMKKAYQKGKKIADESGNYSGEDPYECAYMWRVISDTILRANDLWDKLYVLSDLGDMEIMKERIMDSDFALEDTLDAQNEKNTGGYILDTSSQSYDLMNGVYMGIARFLNGLDEEERSDVICNLYKMMDENSELVELTYNDYESATMFDKVISENIQF